MLYLIVPVHNRSAVTTRFLQAVAGQSLRDYRVVLVDDGCTDDTVAAARRTLPRRRLEVLTGDGQLWWAGALQLAYRHLVDGPLADDDRVLIINDDVSFQSDFLAAGCALLDEHPDACIQAVGIDRASGLADRGAMADLARLQFRPALPGERPNCLSTRGLLMSGRTFRHSGGFRPRRLPHYLSDYEYTLRLRRRGTPLVVDERFRIEVELELTGLDRPSARSWRGVWNESFSNRAKFNPKHWSAFTAMVCPWWSVPLHIARIWVRFGRSLLATTRSKQKAYS
jgi:GT2 family glycosyltransferase